MPTPKRDTISYRDQELSLTTHLIFVIVHGRYALLILDVPQLHETIRGRGQELEGVTDEVDPQDRVCVSFEGLRCIRSIQSQANSAHLDTREVLEVP